MSIVPSRSNTTVIQGDGVDLDQWPVNQVPYRSDDGTIMGSGLRILDSGALLAPVGFAVESGSVDFGDVIRLSESATFLGIQNMISGIRYQLLDYAVPRTSAASRPYYFYLKEAERLVSATIESGSTITTNPLSFDYTTQYSSRVNSLVFTANAVITNFRMRIVDKTSGVTLKYFPSKASWGTGQQGANLDVGDNTLDFQDTALIFQAGTQITFEIQADNISLAGSSSGTPKFSGYIQEGQYIGVSNLQDISNLQNQINSISSGFSGKYSDLVGVPTSFTPSAHTHAIAEVNGLQANLDSLALAVSQANASISSLSIVASTGNYQDLINKPAIPSSTSQLNNDSGYITINHTHPISDVAGLQSALDSKQSSSGNIPASRISGLAAVATTGSYNSLSNAPVIPTNLSSFNNDAGYITIAQVPAQTVSWADIQNKPTSFTPSPHTHVISDVSGLQAALNAKADSGASISYNSLTDKPVLFSGTYNDLTGKPVLFSGSYLDLTNKPIYATVASTGNYNDLINKPVIPSVNYPVTSVNTKIGDVTLSYTDVGAASASHTHTITQITGLQPALDAKISVGASIPYGNLTGTPTIPPAQVNTDWNSVAGVSQLLNKPTTLAGYGITDAVNSSALSNYVTNTQYTNGLNAKFNNPTGSALQYIRGDGSLATFPTIPTIPTNISVFTNDSGYITLSQSRAGLILNTNGTSGTASYNTSTGILNIPVIPVVPTTISSFTNDVSYITAAQARNSISVTNAGTGGNSTYNNTTGVLNIPTIPTVPTVVSAFTNDSAYITSTSLPIVRRVDNSLVARKKVKYYTVVSDSSTAVWTVNLGTDFTEVLDVQVQPVSVANTVAGIRQSSLNSYTSTSTSISGMTYGNNVLTTVLVGVGANTLAIIPSTTVRVRVEGVGT